MSAVCTMSCTQSCLPVLFTFHLISSLISPRIVCTPRNISLLYLPILQHTPVNGSDFAGGQVKNLFAHANEQTTLKWFCENIGYHVLCGAERYLDVAFFYLVHNKIISYI